MNLLVVIILTLIGFLNGATAVRAVDSFSIVVMPDSQMYTSIDVGPTILNSQMDWVLANTVEKNIKYVLHEGDMTNSNTDAMWTTFQTAISKLDGKMPYALALGNHDYGASGRNSSFFNKYFKKDNWVGQNLGGVMEVNKMDNVYYLFEGGGTKWMIMVLEFGPRQKTIDWANKIISANQNTRVIILTHAYLNIDGELSKIGTTYDPHTYSRQFGTDVNNGTEVWKKLIKKQKNIVLVSNGHYLAPVSSLGAARRLSTNDAGEKVLQQFVNFQNWSNGGGGYMRLLTFYSNEGKIEVKTFSPYLNKSLTDGKNDFVVTGLSLEGVVTGCLCSANGVCATVCTFDKFATPVTYTDPIKCNLSNSLFATAPSEDNKTSWCQVTKRTKGDADGNGIVNNADYFYYVAVVNGGKIPVTVNPDFTGDGEVGAADRTIIIKSLNP
jgi:hypothetical protein